MHILKIQFQRHEHLFYYRSRENGQAQLDAMTSAMDACDPRILRLVDSFNRQASVIVADVSATMLFDTDEDLDAQIELALLQEAAQEKKNRRSAAKPTILPARMQ